MNNGLERLSLIFIFIIFVFAFSNVVVAYDVPAHKGFVNDFANVIDPEVEQDLETKLELLSNEDNGAEIAVVTVKSLDGDVVESVAQEFFDSWKIGKKNADNGVLLLIAIEDRDLRIATGYGAEAFLTDATAGRIIRNKIVPSLKEADYNKAVVDGVDAIIDSSKGIDQAELVSENGSSGDKKSFSDVASFLAFLLIVLSFGGTYFVSYLARSKDWWLGGLFGLLISLFFGSLVVSFLFGFVGLILDYVLSKNYKKWKLEKKTTAWRKTIGGFHSRSGSRSSGSSFGGGRSGGGGASGRW